MPGSNKPRLAKQMRWAARVIGSIAAAFIVTMWIGAAVSEGIGPITVEGATLVLIGIVAVAGCVTSWRGDMVAGILLILTAIGFGIHIGIFAGRNHFLAWLMIGLPYLIAGVLLLVSLRLSKNRERDS